MFKNLFKPKWQSAKPQVRIQAVSNLNPANEEDLHIIETMARGDIESSVRLAAITQLNNTDKQLDLLKQEKDQSVRKSIVDIVVNNIGPTNQAQLQQLSLAVIELGPEALQLLISTTKIPQLAEMAIGSVESEEELKQFAINLPVSHLRQVAAAKLVTEAVLEDVLKASKGKDKSVYRIVKNKLNEMREAQRHEESIEQQVDDVCRSVEQLSRTTHDHMFQAKLDSVQKQWNRLQGYANSDDSKRFSRALELCKQRLDSTLEQETARQVEDQKVRDAMQERMAACDQLEEALRQITENGAVSRDDVPALSALLKTQQVRWEEAEAVVAPAADERKRFSRVQQVLERTLEAAQLLNESAETITELANKLLGVKEANAKELQGLKKKLDRACARIQWPAELSQPEALRLKQQAVEHFDLLSKQLAVKEKEALDKLQGILNGLKENIEKGQLKPAQQFLRDANQKLKFVPAKLAQPFQKQVRELAAQVHEMKDWQGYAILPKKEQLASDMESLVGASLEPQALANKIKRMQDEWRGLGHADGTQELWERFSAAAEKAYEPCKEYFSNLAEVRQRNLEKRQQVVTQLTDYIANYHWSTADWSAVSEVFEVAKQEWRQYSPVERKEGKLVQDQFNGLLDDLRGRLNAEFKSNLAKRQKLIEEAEALVTLEDLQQAIEQAKQLQRKWREVGLIAKRDENKLWKQFRAACDKVFARRDEERQAAVEARDENLKKAESLLEQMELLIQDETKSLAECEVEFKDLQQKYQSVGHIPREKQAVLNERLSVIDAQFKQTVQTAQAAILQDQLAAFWNHVEALDLIEAEWGEQGAADSATLPVIGDEVSSAAKAALEQRINHMQSEGAGAEQLLEQNGDKLHELCIRLEIVGGLESPAEDNARRMAFQVSRLSEGFGQGQQKNQTNSKPIEGLQLEWAEIAPVAPTQRKLFTQRFRQALKQIGEI